MKKPVLVIMAAGMGSRYGGLKQIDPVDEQGHIIMDFSIFDAKRAGFEKVVFIIDECHRSQFGDMHNDIVRHFKNAQFFGFTGTPRFEVNGKTQGKVVQTTKTLFGDCLHSYLIKNAIFDNNVLGFHVEYIKTIDGDYDENDGTKESPFLTIERAKEAVRNADKSDKNGITVRKVCE